METKTGNQVFDGYCRYTFMDNFLRGGFPIEIAPGKIFYVYSRKHGDLERDYNYFEMTSEYYSQGNGNYRDVNQNRRCDAFFTPYVGRENIHKFYNLIQLDGYNPLHIEKVTYIVKTDVAEKLVPGVGGADKNMLKELVTQPFTPGALYEKLLDIAKNSTEAKAMLEQIIAQSQSIDNSKNAEGYWTDHWTYNFDLVEDYLSIHPEDEEQLLYENNYTYFSSSGVV